MAYENTQKMNLEAKYKQKLKEQLEIQASMPSSDIYSREYQTFRQEILPKQYGIYEKACNTSEHIIKLTIKPETQTKLKEAIDTAHLDITPQGVIALSILFPTILMLTLLTISALIGSMFFMLISIIIGATGIMILGRTPYYLANTWRMKASNQMVLCAFYIATYMRHTSNLERAVEFASEHLQPPLSLDLKKVLWDVESGVYESITESLESYLERWRKSNREFVESIHLIESSLYEASEAQRVAVLDKALDVILEGTYENMLHYAQNLKGPITMLHMLGIILPILGLVILPLVVSFMEGVKWYHLATLYNIILPIVIYFLGKNILSKRPTGYGDTDITEANPTLKKYKNIILKIGTQEISIHPASICLIIGAGLFFIALLPPVIHYINPGYDAKIAGFQLLGYRESTQQANNQIIGPFGLGSSIISLFFPLALALSIGLYFKLRSQNIIKIRNEAKKLEEEFSSALFQLGNRLGDGLPAEIAVQKVAEVMKDTTSGRFFKLVSTNISKLGMSVKEALFNPTAGAITTFPSAIIKSSMKVLIESIKKGPRIAAQAILNVARYIKEIHKVNERLKDLLADIISDMKSQISFLTPAIAGVVIGITSMITFILGKLSGNIQNLQAGQVGTDVATLANLFGDGIPTYQFQAVVGIYVFQLVYILTILANGIENGADNLQERYLLGKNLIKSTILYCLIAGIIMITFNTIALKIVAATVTGGA